MTKERKECKKMRYQIKLRCLQLGITQCQLMQMVSERTGEKLDASVWSTYCSGYTKTPKAERCLKVGDQILTELEAAAKK